jgi:iron complex outermembrane receptor protein
MTRTKTPPQRGPSRRALALVTLLIIPTAHAEPELDPLIMSALRVPRPSGEITASVTAFDPDELEKSGVFQLRDALNRSPGVISTSTAGQTGAIGSLFIRGTNTSYSQVVVDGMRLSDSTTPLGNFLGGARVNDLGRIEILRGPHGTIHGGESIGGVLWLETAGGSETPRSRLTAEAGSFNSLSLGGSHQGSVDALSYFFATGYEETDNDARAQDFHQWRAALRADARLDDIWTLRTTFRAVDAYFNDSGNSDNHLDSALATIQATGVISERWTARFHAGIYQEFYDSDSDFGNYGTDLRASSFSTDHEIKLNDDLKLLAGMYLHQDSFRNTIGTDEGRDRYGVHGAIEWQPADGLTLHQSARWEDYDAYGSELTWRSGAAWRISDSGLTLRGGIGSSFRTPTYLDLFGSDFGAGNPDLEAESSLGWDIGLSHAFTRDHLLEMTFFNNRISDRIQSFPTPPVNLGGDTDTSGIEFGLRGAWNDGRFGYHLAWTWLDETLSDQPRNAVNASLDWKPDDKSLVGIGVAHLSDHSWGGNPVAGYTVARLHASRQLTENLRIHARVENLFNENYELSDFFGTVIEGAGTGIHFGITVDW